MNEKQSVLCGFFLIFKFGIITKFDQNHFHCTTHFLRMGHTMMFKREKEHQQKLPIQIDCPKEKNNISLLSMIAYAVPLQNVKNYTAIEHGFVDFFIVHIKCFEWLELDLPKRAPNVSFSFVLNIVATIDDEKWQRLAHKQRS